MNSAGLCRAEDALLVVVDVQPRLAAAMQSADREQVIARAGMLVQGAGLLGVPVIATEQYPKGLGHTEPALAGHLPAGTAIVEKTCFACGGEENFRRVLADSHRRQVVIAGMEAHVCVLQTALGLAHEGYDVFVAEDAICSRSGENARNATERMRGSAVITNTESVLFEWLRDARHEQFKAISALVK